MGQKYSIEALHPIRHMDEYIAEIMAGSVAPFRTKVLKERFAKVKDLAYEMYKDTYTLIIELDGEMMQDPEQLWKHDLESVRIFAMSSNYSYGNYSDENLHPIRHLENYVKEIKENELLGERITVLKTRLGIVLRLAVRLYYDAERLIRILD